MKVNYDPKYVQPNHPRPPPQDGNISAQRLLAAREAYGVSTSQAAEKRLKHSLEEAAKVKRQQARGDATTKNNNNNTSHLSTPNAPPSNKTYYTKRDAVKTQSAGSTTSKQVRTHLLYCDSAHKNHMTIGCPHMQRHKDHNIRD